MSGYAIICECAWLLMIQTFGIYYESYLLTIMEPNASLGRGADTGANGSHTRTSKE